MWDAAHVDAKDVTGTPQFGWIYPMDVSSDDAALLELSATTIRSCRGNTEHLRKL
jgi:hypothetical protein